MGGSAGALGTAARPVSVSSFIDDSHSWATSFLEETHIVHRVRHNYEFDKYLHNQSSKEAGGLRLWETHDDDRILDEDGNLNIEKANWDGNGPIRIFVQWFQSSYTSFSHPII